MSHLKPNANPTNAAVPAAAVPIAVTPTAVTVVGGYLGAGKTTLVNHVLRNSDERIAVIVNDFGEISIDEDLIVAADADKLTLANGCICCSLADGFATALTQVRSSDPAPTRLLIEASGVSDPAQIAAYGHTTGLRLDAVAVVVDAEIVQERANDRWVADTVRRQIASADLLILNKIDLLRPPAASSASGAAKSASDDLCDWLRKIAPGAAIVRATNAEVPLDVLFDSAVDTALDAEVAADVPPGVPPAVPTVVDEHDAADVFESCTILLDKPIPMETMKALLDDLPEYVLRLKGFVQLSDSDRASDSDREGAGTGDYVVQAVGKRTTITPIDTYNNTPTDTNTELHSTSNQRRNHYALSLVVLKNPTTYNLDVLNWLESYLF